MLRNVRESRAFLIIQRDWWVKGGRQITKRLMWSIKSQNSSWVLLRNLTVTPLNSQLSLNYTSSLSSPLLPSIATLKLSKLDHQNHTFTILTLKWIKKNKHLHMVQMQLLCYFLLHAHFLCISYLKNIFFQLLKGMVS